jgi:CO dehydrogenase/acetyl-CoA synthase alpha subunit
MYFQDYGMEKRAMEGYASLKQKADGCFTCADTSCEKVCPYELPVASMLRKAHEQLSFSG